MTLHKYREILSKLNPFSRSGFYLIYPDLLQSVSDLSSSVQTGSGFDQIQATAKSPDYNLTLSIPVVFGLALI